jgi:type IV pilus assembly protein PilO
MNVTFKLKPIGWKPLKGKGTGSDPRIVMRIVLGVLLLANVAAALVLFRPWADSPEELERKLGQLRSEIKPSEAAVERLRTLVEKSRQAHIEGDSFMGEYFMDRRTASSTIIIELKEAATDAGIQQQEHTFAYEPIEGSEDLYMMTISGNYEGLYPDLVKFINLLDRSPRFLILDTLTAAPERTAGVLNMNFKMNAFVIEGKTVQAEEEPGDNGSEEPGASPEEGTEEVKRVELAKEARAE